MPTSSWTCNASRSWRTYTNAWRTSNNYVYQGQYDGWGLHRGLWFFNDSSIRSTLSGQNITGIRLKATRRSAGGASAAGTPQIRLHNYSSQPSGQPTWVTSAQTPQSWAWGETKWATLPNWWGSWLRDGDARGIMLYTSSNTPYMIFNGSGSAVLEITYEPAIVAPATPGGFSIGTVTTTSAYLSWNSVSNADHYRYTNQQLNPTGSTNEFTTQNTSVTNSSGISSNRRYRWRVRAENSAGVSSYTGYLYRTTLPLTPGGVGASTPAGTAGETSITISWNHIAGTELDRYRVDRSGGGTVTTTANSRTWGGLSPDTTYSFRVRSENAQGNSSYSGWVSSKTNLPAPATPSQPSASNLAETSVTISWNAVSYAANYDLEHNGAIIRSATTSRSHSVTGLADGATHSFRVRARNATATSSYSTARVVDTPPIHVAPPVPTAIGPTGFVQPGFISLTGHTAEMDQDKNYALDQRIRWEVSKDPDFTSDVFETYSFASAYGDPGTKTFSLGLDEDLEGAGNYYIRARTEHNGNFDQESAWTANVEFTFTRVKVWNGTSWVQRRVYVYDGAAWPEKTLYTFGDPEGGSVGTQWV